MLGVDTALLTSLPGESLHERWTDSVRIAAPPHQIRMPSYESQTSEESQVYGFARAALAVVDRRECQ